MLDGCSFIDFHVASSKGEEETVVECVMTSHKTIPCGLPF
jgi:hypothetical protein